MLRRRGRASLQSWASSPPPASGSYPWGSEGSSEALRSAGLGGSSRSWLQPSSAGAGAALVAGDKCSEAGCTPAERCLAGGGNHLAQLRERCTLLLMSRKMLFSVLLRDSCSPVVLLFFLFFSEMSKDPLVFSEKNQKCPLYSFPKIHRNESTDQSWFCIYVLKWLIQSGFNLLGWMLFWIDFVLLLWYYSKGVLCVCLSISALTVALVGSQGSLWAERFPRSFYTLLPWRRCPYMERRKPIFRHCSGGHMTLAWGESREERLYIKLSQ